MSSYAERFEELIFSSPEMVSDMRCVRDLGLQESYIAAGYVRNYIWDCLHGYKKRTPLNDIDVIYFDPIDTDERTEKRYEQQLREMTGNPLWSVKNQARMHVQNGDAPYSSVEDAIRHWPENVTAVAIRLETDERLSWLCPYGLEALFEFKVMRSTLFQDEVYYRKRIGRKRWKELWPQLDIE